MNQTTTDVFWLRACLFLAGYCIGFWLRAWIARTREQDFIHALQAQARFHDEEKRNLIKCLCPPPRADLTAHTRDDTN